MLPLGKLAMLGALAAMSQPTAEPVKRRRMWKDHDTSATGSISKDERAIRNLKKKRAKLDKRRNRNK
jgi:hypothetical protein